MKLWGGCRRPFVTACYSTAAPGACSRSIFERVPQQLGWLARFRMSSADDLHDLRKNTGERITQKSSSQGEAFLRGINIK
eukprot:scaffold126876_cov33-Tisochrysis_lutea.AAC.1